MTDLLHTILADPELSGWPQYRTTPDPHEGDLDYDDDSPQAAADNESAWPADEHSATGAEKIRGLIESENSDQYSPGAAESSRLGFGPAPQPAAHTDAGTRTAQEENPPPGPADKTAAESPGADDETGPAAPPLAFDDIAAKPKAFNAAVGSTGQWFKDRDWKSPRTLGIAAAAALTVGSLLAWSFGSNTETQGPTAQITAPASNPNPAPGDTPAVLSDEPITVSTATARCPAPSSDPMNAVRPQSTKPWTCVRAWQIDGQVLELAFDKASVVTAVSIMPGANSAEGDQDQWAKYRTVERLEWAFNDAAHTRCTQETGSLRQLATLTITPANCSQKGTWQPVIASAASVTIQKTAEPSNPNTLNGRTSDPGGEGYTAFAVSRLEIIGHPAG